MKKHKIQLIIDAENDLFNIYKFIAINDSKSAAEKLINILEDACYSLEEFPNRGHIPFELERIGITEYLEINCKPFRIIYRIIKEKVIIHCIIDGRRDLQELLVERLYNR